MTNGHDAVRAARLGSLLLLGGIGAVVLLWLLFAWAAMPNLLSGMDPVHALITWLSTGVCAVLIILAHFAMIRHLRGFVARRQADAR